MYSGVSYGVAASALSFGTNFVATLLVGYKAWVSRRFIRKHVIAGSLARQTERLFTLLVESGALYCVLWAVVVAWQIGDYQAAVETKAGTNTFWDVFGVFIRGALVPLIAIYPTVIIILVALNRSQVEHGFERDGGPELISPGRLPLSTLTVTVGSVAAEQDNPHGAGLYDAHLAILP
ncbi:hypothetical protein GSI_04171 [Ganoderma sinense ZZ0214-1]|uniref:Uncharacterized protein n=1 Tax=Ganoderma sinense ZZ0214-1 TaxID=1077348 RepID=A0A2G8SJ15_9APHY|nr:hypothetical protein GSI_04171 [Ganoderma sinense ZZ0214-1]